MNFLALWDILEKIRDHFAKTLLKVRESKLSSKFDFENFLDFFLEIFLEIHFRVAEK